MNNRQEVIQNIRDNIIMLKDVVEELESDVTRLCSEDDSLLEKMEKINQVHIDKLDNECLGDMQ